MKPAAFSLLRRAQHGVGDKLTISASRVLLSCPCFCTALRMRMSVASRLSLFIGRQFSQGPDPIVSPQHWARLFRKQRLNPSNYVRRNEQSADATSPTRCRTTAPAKPTRSCANSCQTQPPGDVAPGELRRQRKSDPVAEASQKPRHSSAFLKTLEITRETGAPDRIRTCDLCLRRAALYPAELRVLWALVVRCIADGLRRGNA